MPRRWQTALLVATGLLLAATTVAGWWWGLADLDEGTRLGLAGAVAAALGWAAHARTVAGAALRAPLATIVLPAALFGAAYGALLAAEAIQARTRDHSGAFEPTDEYALGVWIDPAPLLWFAAASLVAGAVLGVLARLAAGTGGRIGAPPTVLLLLPFAAEALRLGGRGQALGVACTLASALWLLTAVRHAARRAEDRTGTATA